MFYWLKHVDIQLKFNRWDKEVHLWMEELQCLIEKDEDIGRDKKKGNIFAVTYHYDDDEDDDES